MFFTAAHSVILLISAVTLVFAAITVVDLRNTSATYNARLFPFGYFSLAAWVLWLLQYLLLAAPLLSFSSGFSLDAVRSLALIQNALWVSAALSLYSERFSRKSLTLPVLGIFSVAAGLLKKKTRILTSAQFSTLIGTIDGVPTGTLIIALGVSIVQLRLNRIPAAIFIAHGFTQWLWTWYWLTSFGINPVVQLGFPLWRGALLIAWMKFISEMAQRAQPLRTTFANPADKSVISDDQRADLAKLLRPIRVMISSTIEDLLPER